MNLWLLRGRNREFGMAMYTLLYLKWITNKDYCVVHGTLHCYVTAWTGGGLGGEWIYIISA